PKARPLETRQSVSAIAKSKADSTEDLLLTSLPTIAASNQAAAQNFVSSLPDLQKMKIKSTVDAARPPMPNIESLALSEEQAAKITSGGGDAAELARLFGVYTGQIQARIDR